MVLEQFFRARYYLSALFIVTSFVDVLIGTNPFLSCGRRYMKFGMGVGVLCGHWTALELSNGKDVAAT